jgi:transmembrane sensor
MTQYSEATPPSIDEQAALWCISLSEGVLDADEQAAFDAWIAAPAHAGAFDEALRVWRAADQAMAMPELVRIRSESLDLLHRVQRARWVRRPSQRWRWPAALAASLLLILTSVTLLYDPATIYRTGTGERRVAMLEDGSRISLDADTEIAVRLTNDRRELDLSRGRAKFDVARDPLRPFSVTVGDKIVVATGTSFSVERFRRQARVLLYEGNVAVLNERDDKPVRAWGRGAGRPADGLLTPGRELVVALEVPSAEAVVRAVDPARALSWEGGQLEFEDETLPVAAERMNRYSARKIVIGDAEIAKLRINGVFDAGNVDALIEAITASNDVQVTRRDADLVLTVR